MRWQQDDGSRTGLLGPGGVPGAQAGAGGPWGAPGGPGRGAEPPGARGAVQPLAGPNVPYQRFPNGWNGSRQ